MGSAAAQRRFTNSFSTSNSIPNKSIKLIPVPPPPEVMDENILKKLPALPASLKNVSPYVQRAEELRAKDPVMAYWCMYYAAQLGLDAKSHEPGSREYLLALITLLEKFKEQLGPNDAVDHEAAGAAYVENFALKVFSLADNEDRQGNATRSTAKKFLAAANFLELLKVFEKTNNAQVNDEKVKYAKWKATDIAKAFREGRKPTPGPAGQQIETQDEATPGMANNDDTPRGRVGDGFIPDVSVTTTQDAEPHTPPRKPKALSLGSNLGLGGPISPGNWSTVATPGSEAAGPSSFSTRLASRNAYNKWKDSQVEGPADTGPEVAGVEAWDENGMGSAPIDIPSRRVRFTPSTGGLSSIDGESSNQQISQSPSSTSPPTWQTPANVDPYNAPLPESSPSTSSRTSPEATAAPIPNLGPTEAYSRTGLDMAHGVNPEQGGPYPSPPTSSFASSSMNQGRRSSVSSRTSPRTNGTSYLYPAESPFPQQSGSNLPSAPPYVPGLPPTPPTIPPPPPSIPSRVNYSSPPAPPITTPSPYNAIPPTLPSAPPVLVELTPSVIAKAQKHCRYAISSLEYEDAEQARKELLAALKVLSGG